MQKLGKNWSIDTNKNFLDDFSEESDEPSIVMMASSICALIFDQTSEQALLDHPSIDHSTIASLSQLIGRSLATYPQVTNCMEYKRS